MYTDTKLIIKPATSENICAASVRMAKDPDMMPPANSHAMKTKQMQLTNRSFFIARLAVSCFFKNFGWWSRALLGAAMPHVAHDLASAISSVTSAHTGYAATYASKATGYAAPLFDALFVQVSVVAALRGSDFLS